MPSAPHEEERTPAGEGEEEQMEKVQDNTMGEQPQEDEGALVTLDLRALTRFQEDGPFVRVLADTGAARVVLFAFKAGQTLKSHTTSSQILVQVVRGQITFTAGRHSAQGRAGTLFALEARVPHGITARTDAVVLVTMTPSPTQHSLEAEVFSGLTPIVVRHTSQ